MAHRPVFVPMASGQALVEEVSLALAWSPGFAPVQKAKNVKALHESARQAGFEPVLEVSTKSADERGRQLSAFHLKVRAASLGELPLECAFQGSKVFEAGGPFTDLYRADVRAAKKDPRLRTSGELTGFSFQGESFPLDPPTMFYDWLYLGALLNHREDLAGLQSYAAFSDIEFNPKRSLNCQARSCALFVSLTRRQLLDPAMASPLAFREVLTRYGYGPRVTQPNGRVAQAK